MTKTPQKTACKWLNHALIISNKLASSCDTKISVNIIQPYHLHESIIVFSAMLSYILNKCPFKTLCCYYFTYSIFLTIAKRKGDLKSNIFFFLGNGPHQDTLFKMIFSTPPCTDCYFSWLA